MRFKFTKHEDDMDHDLIIAAIDGEIGKLQEARALLSGAGAATAATEPAVPARMPVRRRLSPAARKRIADAQKKRWAGVGAKGVKTRSTEKRASADHASRKKSAKRRLSPEVRKRIAAAQKKRWAAIKAAKATPAKKAAKKAAAKKTAAAKKASTKALKKAVRKTAVKKTAAKSSQKAPVVNAKKATAISTAAAPVTEATPA
jgi:hypothetical protein